MLYSLVWQWFRRSAHDAEHQGSAIQRDKSHTTPAETPLYITNTKAVSLETSPIYFQCMHLYTCIENS